MKRVLILVALVLLTVLVVAPTTEPASEDPQLRAVAASVNDLRADVAALRRQVRALRRSLRRNTLRDYCGDALAFSWISFIEDALIANHAAGYLMPERPFPPIPGRLRIEPTCTKDAKAVPLDLRTLWPAPPPGGPLIR